MRIEHFEKTSFTVIGKEGSTNDGEGFIQRLWQSANENFSQIEPLVKKAPNGGYAGFWGAMSDFSRGFAPWDDFSCGLYLAGAECEDGSVPPAGWTKWIIPGYEYIRVECDEPDIFGKVINYLEDKGMSLAGAVHDFTCPQTGKNYMCFPVRKL